MIILEDREKEAQGGSHSVYKFLKGRCNEEGIRLFLVALSAQARDSGHRLEE